MIPSGQILSAIRGDILATFPDSPSAYARLDHSLGEWMQNGAYNITGVGARHFRLAASPEDLGAALLHDVENLLNHACEHLVELAAFEHDQGCRSEAWNTTQVYYLGFFAAQGLLMLIGRPVLFLDKKVIGQLQQLGGHSPAPGAGVFRLTRQLDLSSSQCEYEMKRVNQRVHDATWLAALQYLRDKVPPKAQQTVDSEFLLYEQLTATTLCKEYGGYQWPASLRSRVNYRPGFAYRTFSDRRTWGMKKVLARLVATKASARIAALREAATHVHADPGNLTAQGGMLVHVALTLFCLIRKCYTDLTERRRIDHRWASRRYQTLRAIDPGGGIRELGCMNDES